MNFKTIVKSFKNKEMRKRVIAVVGILIAYRILAHIPVPLGDATTFKQAVENLINSTDLGGFINLISGGGLTNFSIILVGLSPYITASYPISRPLRIKFTSSLGRRSSVSFFFFSHATNTSGALLRKGFA